MSAKFTSGDSIRSTRTTANMRPKPNVKTASHSLRSGSTMPGMPGYINAHEPENMGGAKGGKGFGPHREGPIGERKGSGASTMAKAKDAPGMSTTNYKASSTRSPGTLKEANDTGSRMMHTKNRGSVGGKAPPASKGQHTLRAAGIDRGSGGKMEKLKARTSSEGKRKSMMY